MTNQERKALIDRENERSGKTYKCCNCKKICKGYGNNPAPLVNDEKSRCCDECNKEVIIYRMLCSGWGQ